MTVQKQSGFILITCMSVMVYYTIRDVSLFAQTRNSVDRLEERIDNHIRASDYDLQDLMKFRLESDRRITALEGIADSSTFLLRAMTAGIFGIIAERLAAWANRMRRRSNTGHSLLNGDSDNED